jgi:hypothetical protein
MRLGGSAYRDHDHGQVGPGEQVRGGGHHFRSSDRGRMLDCSHQLGQGATLGRGYGLVLPRRPPGPGQSGHCPGSQRGDQKPSTGLPLAPRHRLPGERAQKLLCRQHAARQGKNQGDEPEEGGQEADDVATAKHCRRAYCRGPNWTICPSARRTRRLQPGTRCREPRLKALFPRLGQGVHQAVVP